MRVLVIGGGVIGLSTAWALARAGHEPLLFEAGPLPNPGGASHDQHRLIRSLYGAERGYARMVGDAYAAWDRLWADLGRQHYVEAGALGISLQSPERVDDPLAASLATLRDLELEHELLDAAQLAELCPYFQVPERAWGLLSRPGGVLLADKIVGHLAGWLRRAGVDLFPETRAIDIDPEAGAVRLADGQIALGDAIVVAAGAWTGKLVPALADRQTPQRQFVAFLAPPEAQAAAWAAAPAIVQLPTALDSYCCPPVQGTRLKLGAVAARRASDPDALAEGSYEEAEALLAPFREILTDGADYRVVGYKACPYAVSHDAERFLSHREGCLTAVAGCTGHMFKFGALMGEQLAAAATGDLAFETFARWAAGEELVG